MSKEQPLTMDKKQIWTEIVCPVCGEYAELDRTTETVAIYSCANVGCAIATPVLLTSESSPATPQPEGDAGAMAKPAGYWNFDTMQADRDAWRKAYQELSKQNQETSRDNWRLQMRLEELERVLRKSANVWGDFLKASAEYPEWEFDNWLMDKGNTGESTFTEAYYVLHKA